MSYPRNTLPTPEAVLQGMQSVISQPPAGVAPASGRAAAIAVIDGADGRLGATVLAALRRILPDAELWPVGLNATAQVAMLGALGDALPPAVPGDALHRATAILGPSDILLPGSLDGEVTSDLTAALASSPARILLLPPREPRLRWVAAPDWPPERWIENVMIEVADTVKSV